MVSSSRKGIAIFTGKQRAFTPISLLPVVGNSGYSIGYLFMIIAYCFAFPSQWLHSYGRLTYDDIKRVPLWKYRPQEARKSTSDSILPPRAKGGNHDDQK
jgi:hypothetical protein